MKKIKGLGLILLMLAFGCSTSRITYSWKAQDSSPQKYRKLLVLGLVRDADRSMQARMEDHLVGDLKRLGYVATSSLAEYGPNAFEGMDEVTAVKTLKNSGVDAVITIVLLDKEKERNYIPGRVYYSPYGYYQNRFWGYRTTLYNRIYESGYYVTETKYFWESNLYEMDTQKLIYSVQTKSFGPVNVENMAHEYGQMIVSNMVKNGVLQNQSLSGQKGF